ncbi:unnamed protein product [Adineta ricciae]|uniref:Uncharacterized protein n=1 Tax=Adineta ricciae TaxID=249248 RepID=A0A813Z6E5_ADIRI|nr:unnamed protein product [Adineta ricciae]CAF0986747.1 unnamed protein product [Adineta ricciae]
MTDKADLIWQIFETIEKNDSGHILWNLLNQASTTNDGIVYMTYGNQTPRSLAEQLHREHLLKLIELHQKLIYHQAQF